MAIFLCPVRSMREYTGNNSEGSTTPPVDEPARVVYSLGAED